MMSTSRRMRRSRDNNNTSSSSNSGVSGSDAAALLSGFDLYNIQGDSVAALEVFKKQQQQQQEEEEKPQQQLPNKNRKGKIKQQQQQEETTPTTTTSFANKYNCLLLSRLSSQAQAADPTCSDLMQKVNEIEEQFHAKKSNDLTTRKRKRNDLIFAYNRALIWQTTGNYKQAAQLCVEKLQDAIESKKLMKPPGDNDELATMVVSSRMGLLLLECILAVSVGHGSQKELLGISIEADQIIDWLELFDSEKDPQHKFLLNLYRSRVDLASLAPSGKHSEAKIRSARKELKQAMDVFQNKLRPSFGAETTGSVNSSSAEELSTNTTQQQQQPPSSVVLQKHNQSALSLKANSEQIKGNSKKSLILCAEALAATTATDDGYQAIHANNLAVVYETNGKRHLALHALAKSLRAGGGGGGGNNKNERWYPDGTARPDPTILVLHNSAICALQARNYFAAYECMATCVARSTIFSARPRCWLRMAESCIGLFCEIKSEYNGTKFTAIEINDGEPKGIVLDNAMFSDHPEIIKEEPEAVLASAEDLAQVKRNPLIRARVALRYALEHGEEKLSQEALKSAWLTLSYVHLAFTEFDKALDMANKVLKNADQPPPQTDQVTMLLAHKRMVATARMYAAEASCAQGETMAAMKFLVGDGQDDAFDRLASDLGGVTLETAATSAKGKRRLARAQTMVRSSASTVTAAMGNVTAAKQLAMSAQSMEDAYNSCNRERSVARRALIYTLLREGQHGPALALLRSLR